MGTALSRGGRLKVFGMEYGKDFGQYTETQRRRELGFVGRRAEEMTVRFQTYIISAVLSVLIILAFKFLNPEIYKE